MVALQKENPALQPMLSIIQVQETQAEAQKYGESMSLKILIGYKFVPDHLELL